MKNRPYLNGNRSIIRCPKCGSIFVNRRFKKCLKCKVGLKFAGELIYVGDYYWDNGKWITYEDLEKRYEMTIDK